MDEVDPDHDTPEDIARDKADERSVDPEFAPPNERAPGLRGRDRDDDFDDGRGVDGDFRKPHR